MNRTSGSTKKTRGIAEQKPQLTIADMRRNHLLSGENRELWSVKFKNHYNGILTWFHLRNIWFEKGEPDEPIDDPGEEEAVDLAEEEDDEEAKPSKGKKLALEGWFELHYVIQGSVDEGGRLSTGSAQVIDQTISFAATSCNYGKARFWFVCSDCKRQAGILYLADKRLACRKCHNLGYGAQSLSKSSRAMGSILSESELKRRWDKAKRPRYRGKFTKNFKRASQAEEKNRLAVQFEVERMEKKKDAIRARIEKLREEIEKREKKEADPPVVGEG
jgi:hypothetical protein